MTKIYYIITIGTNFLSFDSYNCGYPYLTEWFEDAKKYNNIESAEKDFNKIKNMFPNLFLSFQQCNIQKIKIIFK